MLTKFISWIWCHILGIHTYVGWHGINTRSVTAHCIDCGDTVVYEAEDRKTPESEGADSETA